MKTIGVDKIRSYMRFQTVYSYAPFLDVSFENVLLKWNKNLYGITGALHIYIYRERERASERERERERDHTYSQAHTLSLTHSPPTASQEVLFLYHWRHGYAREQVVRGRILPRGVAHSGSKDVARNPYTLVARVLYIFTTQSKALECVRNPYTFSRVLYLVTKRPRALTT
jgi:hypothetical protein